MQIVHIQTQITTVLGRLDDDGNVVQTFTAQAQPTSLSDEAWVEQARLIREKRGELAAQGQPETNGRIPDNLLA